MYSLQLKKFARGTVSSLVLTGIIVAASSTSLTANADTMSSADSDKNMSIDDKHMTMTGDQDYDFAIMMRMHHLQGVKMAQKEIDKGKDPDMRTAAKKIVDAQKKEIAEFDKWLAAHPQKSK